MTWLSWWRSRMSFPLRFLADLFLARKEFLLVRERLLSLSSMALQWGIRVFLPVLRSTMIIEMLDCLLFSLLIGFFVENSVFDDRNSLSEFFLAGKPSSSCYA